MSHVYVLGLTSCRVKPFAVSGHRIEFIEIANLFAAIERRAAPTSVSEAELRSQHDIVTAIFARTDDLLPARFGAWIDTRELNDVVAHKETTLRAALELVHRRVQMTIRFLAYSTSARQDRRSGGRPATGTDYLQARQSAVRSMPAEAAAIHAAVSDLLVAERVSPGFERSAEGLEPVELRQPPSLYHLISRDAVIAYAATTEPFRSATIAISGPWPPFAFVPDPWL